MREKPTNRVCKSWSGRCSKISEISASGEVEIWMGTSRLTGAGFAAQSMAPAATSFLDFPATGLGAALRLGSGFSGPVLLLVAVTISCSDVSVVW